jgi:hypothetical protein
VLPTVLTENWHGSVHLLTGYECSQRPLRFERVKALQGMAVPVIRRALEQQVAKQHAAAEAAHKGAAGAEAAPPDEGSGSADGAHAAGASASAAVAAEASAPAPTTAASAQPRSSAGDAATPRDAEPQPQGCAEGTHHISGPHAPAEQCRDPQACRMHHANLLCGVHVPRCGCWRMTLSFIPNPDI